MVALAKYNENMMNQTLTQEINIGYFKPLSQLPNSTFRRSKIYLLVFSTFLFVLQCSIFYLNFPPHSVLYLKWRCWNQWSLYYLDIEIQISECASQRCSYSVSWLITTWLLWSTTRKQKGKESWFHTLMHLLLHILT